jgi:uncharacterized protein (TIGR00369 family)
MTDDHMRPLTNDEWGIESSCFVCEPRNTAGLRISFHHDVEAHRVVAKFSLDERFSGAPQYVHGGVLLAVLDEAMAWATIAIEGRLAVTTETTSRFDRPVMVGRDHRVHAWIDGTEGRIVRTGAEIVDARDRRCVTATAIFTGLDEEQLVDAAGAEITAEAATYAYQGSAQ